MDLDNELAALDVEYFSPSSEDDATNFSADEGNSSPSATQNTLVNIFTSPFVLDKKESARIDGLMPNLVALKNVILVFLLTLYVSIVIHLWSIHTQNKILFY